MVAFLFPSPNLTAFSSSWPRSRFSASWSRLYRLGSADAGVSWCPVLASFDAVRAICRNDADGERRCLEHRSHSL